MANVSDNNVIYGSIFNNMDFRTAIIKAQQRFLEREELKKNIIIPELSITSEEELKKKNIEIEALKNFIIKISPDIRVEAVREKPDFELLYQGNLIGAELTSIVNFNDHIGYINKLFKKVEGKIQENYPTYKYLVNCYFNKDLCVTRDSIDTQCDELYGIFVSIFDGGFECNKSYQVISNPYIYELSFQKHTQQVSLAPNTGADYCYSICIEQINKTVKTKDRKSCEYDKVYDEKWLLIDVPIDSKCGNQCLPDDITELTAALVKNNFDKIYIHSFGEFHCLK